MGQSPPRISDYAFISDCHTAALIAGGRVGWLCLPRFDSPSVFASILDEERGGFFSIEPAGPFRLARTYEPGTNVLTTRFEGAAGILEITDCLPVHDAGVLSGEGAPYHALLRRVRCLAGRVMVEALYDPRPSYGRPSMARCAEDGRWLIEGDAALLVLDSPLPLVHENDRVLRSAFLLSAGEEASFTLQWCAGSGGGPPPERIDAANAIGTTIDAWRQWSSRLDYEGPYYEEVLRSALVLKGLIYAPTGAILAAPSASLPESLGGKRNWDYRYCWLRDATLTLYALERIGYADEAHAFRRWLERALAGHVDDLHIVYNVLGEEIPPERELPQFCGFGDSRPVHVGNAARDQTQLDVYGELLDAAFFGHKHGVTIDDEYWSLIAALADHVCDHWRDPDHSIWEMRTSPQQFVYSKVLCWVCLNRSVRLANALRRDGRAERWTREMDAIREDVLRHGYNSSMGAFVQAYGSSHLDAANLSFPMLGFIEARDPRMAGTIRLTRERLRKNGLVLRYAGVDDGVGGEEGAFLLCSFWLVDALCMLGERKEARQQFEALIQHCNDVGLLSEQLDIETKHMLGNFPQAFSHQALITSALNLQGGPPNRRHSNHGREQRRDGAGAEGAAP